MCKDFQCRSINYSLIQSPVRFVCDRANPGLPTPRTSETVFRRRHNGTPRLFPRYPPTPPPLRTGVPLVRPSGRRGGRRKEPTGEGDKKGEKEGKKGEERRWKVNKGGEHTDPTSTDLLKEENNVPFLPCLSPTRSPTGPGFLPSDPTINIRLPRITPEERWLGVGLDVWSSDSQRGLWDP